MKEFGDRVAVVTGAASGIGRGLAQRFAAEGMKVVLADVEEEALDEAANEIGSEGGTALAVVTDVSRAEDVEALAERTVGEFGGVHVLCNNAGVAVWGTSWEQSPEDWRWVLGVNLWGVIHGLRAFVPIMLKQDSEGHIVNTASVGGLVSAPMQSVYQVSKHGVVTLSESLHHELALMRAKVRVSVLCPLWVDTRIMDAARNRPHDLPAGGASVPPPVQVMEQLMRQILSRGLSPAEVAAKVVEAIKEERFYILTDSESTEFVRARMENIMAERNPVFDPSALAKQLTQSD